MGKPATKLQPVSALAMIPVVRPRPPAWLLAALLALVTVALYWPATQCDFIKSDDPTYVSENPHVQVGLSWAGVKWAFTNTEQGAYWAPLMWMSHEVTCQFFGLNPWGHHLINVLLHAANTAMVFLLFRRMTGATWRSVMLAALFGWHPLRVESVVWVTERKDVLSLFFGLLTMLFYVNYASARIENRKSKIGNYLLALLFFVFSLMSKAMLVTLPCVLLLLDYWPLQRLTGDKWKVTRAKQLVLEKIPFFALAVAASVVTFVVQKQGGAVMTMESLPLGARVGNALVSYCRYLGNFFWPTDLAVYYPHPGYWPLEQVLLSGVLLCAISLFVFAKRHRHPFLLTGWLWFVGTLVPVIQLVQSGGQAMADRFTYFPSLGVLIVAVWGVHELARNVSQRVIILSVAGAAAIVLCMGLTRHQIGYWKDSETLFRHTLKVTNNNCMIIKALGDVLFKQGKTDEAIRQYQEAFRLNPNDAEACYNLGVALTEKGRTDEAMSQYREALRLKPDYADAHFNLGILLFHQGRTDEAIGQFQEVVHLKPDDADARVNLGVALFKGGQTDGAISQFREALRLKPDNAVAQSNLAKALELKNKSAAQPSRPGNP